MRFSRNDRAVEVIKLFIMWLTRRFQRKEKSKFKAGSRYYTSGDARAYLFIHLSIPSFRELTRTPSRKYIYFLESNDQYGRERILVQLSCVNIRRVNFHRHSQESAAKRQFLQKSASNLLKVRPCR